MNDYIPTIIIALVGALFSGLGFWLLHVRDRLVREEQLRQSDRTNRS